MFMSGTFKFGALRQSDCCLLEDVDLDKAIGDMYATSTNYGDDVPPVKMSAATPGKSVDLSSDGIFLSVLYSTLKNIRKSKRTGLEDLLFSCTISRAYMARLQCAGNTVASRQAAGELRSAISREYGNESGKLFRRAALIISCRLYLDSQFSHQKA